MGFKQKRNKKREKEKRRNASRRRQNDEMMMMMRSSRSSHLHPACRTEKKTNKTTTMTTHTKFHAKFERRARPQEKRWAVLVLPRGERRETAMRGMTWRMSPPARSLGCVSLSFLHCTHK